MEKFIVTQIDIKNSILADQQAFDTLMDAELFIKNIYAKIKHEYKELNSKCVTHNVKVFLKIPNKNGYLNNYNQIIYIEDAFEYPIYGFIIKNFNFKI